MRMWAALMATIRMMTRGLISRMILSTNGTTMVGVMQVAVSNRSILAGVSWNPQEIPTME